MFLLLLTVFIVVYKKVLHHEMNISENKYITINIAAHRVEALRGAHRQGTSWRNKRQLDDAGFVRLQLP